MPNAIVGPFLPLLIFLGFASLLLVWMWWSASMKQQMKEALFRNRGIPYRNSIALLLGIIASFLPLTGGIWTVATAAWVFVATLALATALLVLVRPAPSRELDRFSWGLVMIMLLGFGLGVLIYQTRSWWIWLWRQYLRINNEGAILLEALFLLGVILGFFVVRNWAKEQKDFVSSLSAVLSGAFVATILGKLTEGPAGAGLSPLRAFAFYALGFTISGSLNLLAAGRLTANYVNKRSISSRAILDFLYGSERTKLIDGYFLKNFEEDKDYAKARLTEAMVEYRKLVEREFAERMQQRITRLNRNCWELIAIECDKDRNEEKHVSPETVDEKKPQRIIYRRVRAERVADGEESDNQNAVHAEMFRVGVTVQWQDTLEYISASGQYRQPFPLVRSVSGLALRFRQTIVMDRDAKKRFRDSDQPDGICPCEIEQRRGLDEIDYLSYIAIPIVSRLGSPHEISLGVVTIDSKLFCAAESELDGATVEGHNDLYTARIAPRKLTEFAVRLYEHGDPDITYLENLTKIIVPIVELYSKCRVGAI